MSGIVPKSITPAEVVVLGATGPVGKGIVAALLEAGSPVLAVGPERKPLDALRQHFAEEPGLEVLVGSLRTDASASRLAATIGARPRRLGAVIASLGGELQGGRLLGQPPSFLRERLDEDLLPHLAAARYLLPLLATQADGGVPPHWLLIGGPCAAKPWAGYGHASIAGAAVQMLGQVLHEEALPLGVRVQVLSVQYPVCTPENERNACSHWPTALAVGRSAVALLAGAHSPAAAVVPVVAYDPAAAKAPVRLLGATAPVAPRVPPAPPRRTAA